MRRHTLSLSGCLVLASIAMGAGACALDLDPDHDRGLDRGLDPGPDLGTVRQPGIWTPQGTPLLGAAVDRLGRDVQTHVGALLPTAVYWTPGVDAVWTEYGELVATVHGQQRRGAQLIQDVGAIDISSADDSGRFRVSGASQDVLVTGQTRWRYDVSIWPDGGAGWQSLCGGGKAYVIDGLWRRDGAHVVAGPGGQGEVSFACADGVAAKCISWGYEPDRDLFSGGGGGGDTVDRHQACTRMARADYCGDGASHTFDGTPVLIYDGSDVRPRTLHPVTAFEFLRAPDAGDGPVPDGATTDPWFEAAWRPDGAFCLSKLRWQTLPLGGFCPAILPDPRLPTPAGDPQPGGPSWWFCEDHLPTGSHTDVDPLIDAYGVRVFDSSMRNDLGLYRWEDDGGAAFTTTGGLCGGDSGDHSVAPAPGFDVAHLEGTVLSAATLSTNAQLASAMKVLVSWSDGSGRRATSTASLAADGYAPDRDEGYVFAPVAGDNPAQPALIPPAAAAFVGDRADVGIAPLFRHRRATSTGAEHVTTTSPAAPASWAGAPVQRVFEGWVLEPAGGAGQPCAL